MSNLTSAGTQLSRARMKSIKAGYGDNVCPYANCRCEGGARPLKDPTYDPGNGICSGPVCYCPDGSRIMGPNCPCVDDGPAT